jgi:hypothetical protein
VPHREVDPHAVGPRSQHTTRISHLPLARSLPGSLNSRISCSARRRCPPFPRAGRTPPDPLLWCPTLPPSVHAQSEAPSSPSTPGPCLRGRKPNPGASRCVTTTLLPWTQTAASGNPTHGHCRVPEKKPDILLAFLSNITRISNATKNVLIIDLNNFRYLSASARIYYCIISPGSIQNIVIYIFPKEDIID